MIVQKLVGMLAEVDLDLLMYMYMSYIKLMNGKTNAPLKTTNIGRFFVCGTMCVAYGPAFGPNLIPLLC